jgi:hypothetical protein
VFLVLAAVCVLLQIAVVVFQRWVLYILY